MQKTLGLYLSHIHSIASLYSDIVNCLHCAASGVIPTTRCNGVSDEHNTPGWNEYVRDAHSEARDAFKLWVRSSKPRQGDVFQSMKQSRARFKFKLRQCKRDEARVRADILANDLVKRNSTLFWNHVSKQHRRCQALTLGLWVQWPGGPVDLKTYWPPKKLTGPGGQ